MQNFRPFIKECYEELDKCNIPYSKHIEWKTSGRLTKTWGYAEKWGKRYTITLSEILLADNVNSVAIKDTMIHEILHTIPKCMNHGAEWKKYASIVNSHYPQYNIKRTTSCEEKGIEKTEKYKYVLKCKECGHTYFYTRQTKAVKNYEKFHCGYCEGHLELIIND